jgi:translocation and assembly module TamA
MAETGDAALDQALRDTSPLLRLAEQAPVDAFGLIARATAEPVALEDVLRAEGFWGGLVEVRIAGEPAGTPGLAQRLAEPAAPVPVEVRVTRGPRYTLRRVAIRADSPADAPVVAALPSPALPPDSPARTGAVLDAEAALLTALRQAGHPLAAIAGREVVVEHAARAMDVAWVLAAGPRAAFAMPDITGTSRVNPALIARIAGRLTDQPFDPAAVERTRRALLALGAFDTVRARAGTRLDEAGRLPVTFALTDRPRNAAGISLAYETNYGPTARVFYERRNLFGNAERLRIELEGARLGGEAEDANARIGANLRRPGLFDGRTSLVIDAAVLRERLNAYDRDAIVASALLERPFGERWVLQGGPVVDFGRVGRDGNFESAELAGLLLGGRYDTTDSALDPRGGIRAHTTVIPYVGLDDGGGFVRAIGTLSFYLDLTGEGGTVLALRGRAGSVIGADRVVPLDKRFYAGGGGSVRGYAYQTIGPRDSQGRAEGGTALLEGSAEIRRRISGPFALVAFLDGGSVAEGQVPTTKDMRFGAGLGLRYATGIGPLRIDVGIPLQPEQGDAPYGLYVGLGQSF